MNRKPFLAILITIIVSAVLVIGITAQGIGNTETATIQAQVGQQFTYQGRLENNDATVTGTCDFKFSLFDAASNGAQVGTTQTLTGKSVSDGYFNVTLDFGDGAFDGEARWLAIQVRCPSGSGTYTTLTPRQALTAAPYALSLAPGAVISGTDEGWMLEVINSETSSGVGGFHAQTSSTDSVAIYGFNKAMTGWSNGVIGGTDSTEGNGVIGYAPSTTGWPNGVYGEVWAPEGNGVNGINNATSGYGTGILGSTNSPDGSGVAGRNNAVEGDAKGVYGESQSPDGVGVYGCVITTTGTHSSGVYGINEATSGSGDGIVGISHSPDAAGVAAYNNATTSGYGVWGGITAADGVGVYGENFSTAGSANAIKGVTSGGAAVVGWNEGGGIGIQGHSVDGPAVVATSKNSNIIEGFSDSDLEFLVTNSGSVYADSMFSTPAGDFAEMLPAQEGLEPGDVLIIGKDGKLSRSTMAYQSAVAGVYSTQPGFLGSAHEAELDGNIPLAIVGVVPVKASDENGLIQPGDLLTTSSTPGYAMKADPIEINGVSLYPSGVIIGKALEALEDETGVIQILVTLQ